MAMSAVAHQTHLFPTPAAYREADLDEETDSHGFQGARMTTSKSRELARAVGRQSSPVRSYRPPSGWSVATGNADVVWSGGGSSSGHTHAHAQADFQDDEFSENESWEGDNNTQAGDHRQSTFGHIRNTSFGSSIFAGRGVVQDRRRKEVPPPLPNVPVRHLAAVNNRGSEYNGLRSPAVSTGLTSPGTDYSGFESSSQYSAQEDRDEDRFKDAVMVLPNEDDAKRMEEWSMPRSGTLQATSPVSKASAQELGSEAGNEDAQGERGSVAILDAEAKSSDGVLKTLSVLNPMRDADDRPRMADGTIIPKMPPMPEEAGRGTQEKPRKMRSRRDRSPILSYDGGAAEEERMYEMENGTPDLNRLSTLGPKLKKNSPAPWELDGEELPARPSLKESLRPSADALESHFSRFRGRPSVDSQAKTSYALSESPSLLSGRAPLSLEQEAVDGATASGSASLFSTHRSRGKSVSTNAASVLKGLGLATSVGPASSSKKSKLAKAFRRGADEKKQGSMATLFSEEMSDTSFKHSSDSLPDRSLNASSMTLPTSPHNNRASAGLPVPSVNHSSTTSIQSRRRVSGDSASNVAGWRASPSSPAARAPATSPDLADVIMSSSNKFNNQACSPNLTARVSPRSGPRSLPYKKSSMLGYDGSGRPVVPPTPTRKIPPIPGRPNDETRTSEASSDSPSTRVKGSPPSTGVEHSESSTNTPVSLSSSGSLSKFPGYPVRSASSGSTAGRPMLLPTPGSHEGVQYKLISLEQAREKAKMKQNQELLTEPSSANLVAETNSIKASASTNSFRSIMDGYHARGEDHQGGSVRGLKGKKSGFLRMFNKEKGQDPPFDPPAMTLPNSTNSRDAKGGGGQMPSFSVTGLSGEEESKGDLDGLPKPSLSLRPVSSMFSGFGAEFLDPSIAESASASTLAPGGSPSLGANLSSGLLAPHSPATTFRSQDSSNRLSANSCSSNAHEEAVDRPSKSPISASTSSAGSPSLRRPPHITATPHTSHLPGPTAPNSGDSNSTWNNSRVPSLDAGASGSEGHSQFHSPSTSPTTPNFFQAGSGLGTNLSPGQKTSEDSGRAAAPSRLEPSSSVSPALAVDSITSRPMSSLSVKSDASSGLGPVKHQPSPNTGTNGAVPEEVRMRALELESQISELARELHELRLHHMPNVSSATLSGAFANANGGSSGTAIKACPSCGCSCAEQKRLQSLNEAAVLKGVSVLDRGRALRPSPNMGNSSAKFGGYLNR
ncbi:hypothetical protein IE53DRAFT_224349 [Violaceomyces palustris]|uniref:Uncharacterized protein n=1 Tax=Violaceomyces palustris TaxID=1673888 RepID=A0ACD0NQ01_9BASI|nr:hypothetical protein IE53DRAFT_224349 [Violaceomyces palustris]